MAKAKYLKWIVFLLLLLLLLLPACAQTAQTPAPEPTTAAEPPTSPAPTETPSNKRSVSSSEFGLSLTYDLALAQEAVIQPVAPVPLTPQIMFAEAHPGYLGVTFPGYALARTSMLPYPIDEPQVMVFRTTDFGQYSSGAWNDFPSQRQALENLLAEGTGADASRCAQPPDSSAAFMPYLPWTNAAQVFCAQLKELSFDGGKGIRYLTSYAQGLSPVIDPEVFYTFQGLTDDGQYYISAVFPVDTSVFPEALQQGNLPKPEDLRWMLGEQINALNAQTDDAFQPSLALLDEVLQSIALAE